MKKYFLTLAPLIIFIVICSCSTKNEIGETKAPVYLVVTNITAGMIPFGDIRNDVGMIYDETVSVEFRNEFKNPDYPTYSSYTDIVVTHYRVSFTRTDGGKEAPAGFDANVNFHIPSNDSTLIYGVVILRSHQKTQPPIGFLQPDSLGFEPATNYTSIGCRAWLEFSGATFAGDKVFASGSIDVTFYDYD